MKYKHLLFYLIMGLLFLPMFYLPALQEQFPVLQVEPVVGFFGSTKKPNFYGKKWMAGAFQNSYESYVKAKNPLHPTAIRLKSQMDFSLYGDIMHANILSGKNGYLFQKEGCEAFIGRNYMGRPWLKEKARKLKFITDYFQKEGIPFLVLTPPLKARIMSEHLPDFYRKNASDSTNWQVFPELLKAYEVPVMDFSFLKAYYKTNPPAIYPPSGQHWTSYGSAYAMDSVKVYLEKLLDTTMVEMVYQDSIEMSAARVEFDNELVAGANFLWYPPLAPLPYPKIRYIENEGSYRPNVLSVGDSFYKLIMEFGIVDGLFDKRSTFWYYNHEVYPLRMKDGRRLTNKDLDVLDEIRQRDMVILTVYEGNLERAAFGFVDNLYELLMKQE